MKAYSLWIAGDDKGGWQLSLWADYLEGKVDHERTRRTYTSASDAVTSARQLIGELEKKGGAK